MKKMLLLLVSGLLLVCMAGSAMANPCQVVLSKYSFGIASGEDTATVTVNQYIVPGTRTISVVTSDPSIQAKIDGMSDWASGGNRQLLQYTVSNGPTSGGILVDSNGDPVAKTFTLRVRHTENTDLKAGTVTVSDNEGNIYKLPTGSDAANAGSGAANVAIDSGSATGHASIPEFPTVALPVAALIGLVFIFGRKKEGL